MKQIIFLLAMVTMGTIAFGQTLNEKRATYFTDAATKEFSLNKEQQKELLESRKAYLSTLASLNEQEKNGELNEEDKKKKTNETNQDFKKMMIKLTGKTAAELDPFYTRMRDELKNVK